MDTKTTRVAKGNGAVPLDAITLNVGGVAFDTTRTTLTRGRAKGSMLAAMFSGRFAVQLDRRVR